MRRRRQRPTEEPTGHDRWLISYADFITLLFAFFVVLFASSYRDNQVVKKLSQAIHIGFQQMGAFSGGQSNTGVAYPNLHPDPDHPPSPIPPDAAQSVDILKLQKQLEAAMGQELKNHEVAMRATPEGFVISLNELGFFNSGQADLLPGASDKIKRIAKVLSINGLDLRVEGHSDDQPIHTAQFQSQKHLHCGLRPISPCGRQRNSRRPPAKPACRPRGGRNYKPAASQPVEPIYKNSAWLSVLVLVSLPLFLLRCRCSCS